MVHVYASWPQLSFGSFDGNVSFTSDGKYVLVGTALYERDTGKCLLEDSIPDPHKADNELLAEGFEILGYKLVARSVCSGVDYTGRYFLCARKGETTFVRMSLDTGEVSTVFTGHTKQINSLCFSSDAKLALSASDDGTVRVWDAEMGKCVISITAKGAVQKALFSYDGSMIVFSMGETLCICYIETKKAINCIVLGLKDFDISSLCDCVAVASDSLGLLILDLDQPVEQMRFTPCYDKRENQQDKYTQKKAELVRFMPDGKHVVTAASGMLFYWDIARSTRLSPIFCGTDVKAFDISPDGKYIAAITAAGCRIWKNCYNYVIVPANEWPEVMDVYAKVFARRYPNFDEATIDEVFMKDLRDRGFGNISRDTVRQALDRVCAELVQTAPSTEEVVPLTSLSGDLTIFEGLIFGCYNTDPEITLPKGTIKIGSRCFEGMETLKRIVLPEGLDEIQDGAFRNCCALESVVFPSTLKEIGSEAFAKCPRLVKPSLPKHVLCSEDAFD